METKDQAMVEGGFSSLKPYTSKSFKYDTIASRGKWHDIMFSTAHRFWWYVTVYREHHVVCSSELYRFKLNG